MNQKELKELIDFLIEKDISEFELERGDVKVRIKRGGDSTSPVIAHAVPIAPMAVAAPVPAVQPAAHAAPAPPPATPAPPAPPPAVEEELHQVKSPIVGTFYEAPSPGDPPFVTVGSKVGQDTVVCIIEAMKVFNQITADVNGTITELLVKNGDPVEFGQQLFRVRLG